MHKLDQPQTTSNSNDRDAAVQIGAEEQDKTSLDEAYEKADAIWKGAKKETGDNFSAGYRLAIQLQWLTSANKVERDRAKKEIQRLVKLGKDDIEERWRKECDQMKHDDKPQLFPAIEE